MGANAMLYFCFVGMLSPVASDTRVVSRGQDTTTVLLQVKKDMATVVEPNDATQEMQTAPTPVPAAKTDAKKESNQSPAMAPTSMPSTATAFSQISDLDAEFKDLHQDDNSHIRKLLFNIQLREQLRSKLHEVDQQLATDNMQLAAKTASIAGNQANADALPTAAPAVSNEQGEEDSQGTMLLQRSKSEDLATTTLDRVAALVKDITALRQRDDEEVQALTNNAKSRETLGKEIAFRKEQLSHDGGDLLADLGKIRDLAQQDQQVATQVPPASAVDPTQLVALEQRYQQGQAQAGAVVAAGPSQGMGQMAANPSTMLDASQQQSPQAVNVTG